MAQTKSKTTKAAPKTASAPKKNARPSGNGDLSPADLQAQALELEKALEHALLQDAVLSARRALEELAAETRNQPFERRHGMRLREKALRIEHAFNRLRALRRGECLPPPLPEE
ncbi:MAG: hypothetical protein AB1758_32220 [Candidatus Eremiobacterota bacterium]